MSTRGDIEEAKWISQQDEDLPQEVIDKLDVFQDLKLGVIFHWGLYAQAGIVESWQLSEEDDWARKQPWREDLQTLREDYWGLNTSFNPVNFDPDDWARKCKEAGFKYVIFTTKHHDGFNMYDTKASDYKITAPESPFHADPRSDVLKEVFDAFRKKEMMTGAYYSKADWHSPYYWVPGEHAKGRRASYDPLEKPQMWDRFVDFVHTQLEEIMTNYGKVDILWLDAGWVCPHTGEDLRMDELAEKLRRKQHDLIMVDRTVGGRHENYVTPERKIPDVPPEKVWESNIPLAKNWGYVPDDQYKSVKEIIHSLLKVVAKGGNLILGVGPKPDGTLPEEAEAVLSGLGKWIEKNGDGIYGTRPFGKQTESEYLLTTKNEAVYAFHLLESAHDLPATFSLTEAGLTPEEVADVRLLGSDKPLDCLDAQNGVFEWPVIDEEDAVGLRITLKIG